MKKQKKEEAILLRKNGISINKIAKQIGVSLSSVSLWVKDVILSEEQRKKLHYDNSLKASSIMSEKYRLKRLEFQSEGRKKSKENNSDHKALCMLYWGEGNKQKNVCGFTNSDVHMIKYFLFLLRKNFDIKDNEISISIKTHVNNGLSKEEIEGFWIKELNLPLSCLRKTTIDYRIKNVNNFSRLYYGVCTLRICRTDVVQHIFGAIQEYVGFNNERWLTK